jgi:gas vesicle structural protein
MAKQPGEAMEPQRSREGTLLQVVETLLDKGLVLNADIMVSVAGVELLGIRIRAALASFETAAKFGLDFPAGTDRETVAWKQAIEQKETCPECAKRAPLKQLMDEYCPWCGWQSAYSKRLEENGAAELESSEESSESETDSEAASSK